jgi:hypothetical protein
VTLRTATPSRAGPLWRDPGIRRLALVGLLGSAGFNLLLRAVLLWTIRTRTSTGTAGLATTAMLGATGMGGGANDRPTGLEANCFSLMSQVER